MTRHHPITLGTPPTLKVSPAQRNTLRALGIDEENIELDHGLTETNRERPDCAKPRPRFHLATCAISPAPSSSTYDGVRDYLLNKSRIHVRPAHVVDLVDTV